MVHFHKTWKAVCDRHAGVADYAKMKKDCDEYFHLAHRNEARGVGGIFFDYLEHEPGRRLRLREGRGPGVSRCVRPDRRKPEGPAVDRRAQKAFQEYRRGRYVEFNLIYDRGTLFGLKTAGRIESILMSLPPTVRYPYDPQFAPGTPEAELTEYWLKPREWAGE